MKLSKYRRLLFITVFVFTFHACAELDINVETIVNIEAINENIENPIVKQFLDQVTYDGDYSISRIGEFCYQDTEYRKDWPASFTLSIKNGKGLKVQLFSSGNKLLWDEVATSNSYNILLDNLSPQLIRCIILDEKSSVVMEKQIEVKGRVRMLRLEGMYNVRDIGGWPCGQDGKIKYGMIYRGSEMNGEYNATDSSLIFIHNQLGICADIDLRWPTDKGFTSVSPLGADVVWSGYSVKAYTGIMEETEAKKYVDAFRSINYSIQQGMAVYIHCVSGADRTGTLLFILEGLLGMSEQDLSKEYELSAFYYYRARNDIKDGFDYKKMAEYMMSYRGLSSKKKFENWFLDNGVSKEEIDAFRSIMLETNNN